MKTRIFILVSLLVVCAGMFIFSTAAAFSLPPHWNFTDRTGSSAVVVLQVSANPNIDGTPLANDDYVGVFTPAGLCCGWAQWQGQNISITAWGNNNQTTEVDGFQTGELISYRVYRDSETKEWTTVEVGYLEGTGNYSSNATMVLNKFDVKEVTLPPDWDYKAGTGNNAAVILPTAANPNIKGTPLAGGDYVGVFTPAGLCCGWAKWAGQNISLTVWGDDDQTTEIDGFKANELICYRVYRPTETKEWTSVEVEYSEGTGNYLANATMVLSKFDVTEATLPEHWDFTNNTGSNAAVVLPTDANPNIDGVPLDNGDFIGVFTPAGLCCGWERWQGISLSICVWGDNDQTTEVDGFIGGEQLCYRVYQVSAEKEWTTTAVQYSQGDGNFSANAFLILSQFDVLSAKTISLSLKKGWNMFSINVEPPDPDVAAVMNPIVDKIAIMKNGIGQAYIPQFNINNIGDINFKEGYQVYLKEAATLDVTGKPVDPTTPIDLSAGWNMIGFLPNISINAATALASIVDQLEIIKNGLGENYIPAYDINQIGDMLPGEGYQAYMKSAQTLVYPSGALNVLNLPSLLKEPEKSLLRYFKVNENTGENGVIVIPLDAKLIFPDGFLLESGDEIGVFNSDGLCCGAVVWQERNTALTIWGDNSKTESVDGLKTGEALQFRVWKKSTDEEFPVRVKYRERYPDAYQADGFSVLTELAANLTPTDATEISESVIPTAFSLLQNYPNPFNPQTTIEYHLPQAAEVVLTIYDLQGNSVRRLVRGTIPAGCQTVQWNGRDEAGQLAASGMYFYRIEVKPNESGQASFAEAKKMILMK